MLQLSMQITVSPPQFVLILSCFQALKIPSTVSEINQNKIYHLFTVQVRPAIHSSNLDSKTIKEILKNLISGFPLGVLYHV